MSVNSWNHTMQRVIAEVEARILAVFPEATFRLVEGEDPIGLYLDAYTDAEDAFAVLDLVSDWLVNLSVNAGAPLHVIPLPQKVSALHVILYAAFDKTLFFVPVEISCCSPTTATFWNV